MSRHTVIRILRIFVRQRMWGGVIVGALLMAGAQAQNGRGRQLAPARRPQIAPRRTNVQRRAPAPVQRPQVEPNQRQALGAQQPHPAPIVRQAPTQHEPGAPAIAASRAQNTQTAPSSQTNEQRPAAALNVPRTPASPLVNPGRPGQTQQHLGEWMEAHRNLPVADQQRALENEQGFHNLPAEEQQKLHQQLQRLNNMSPQDRQKRLQENEQMERLAPPQRQQVRSAMAQVGQLPEDRRHAVSRAFYQVRDMPPAQRQSYMNSPQFRSQFNEQERGAINGLIGIAPLWPPLQAQPH